MKKIMIAASAILLGVVANAASVTWIMSNVYQPGSTDTRIAEGNGLVYLFCAEDYSVASVNSLLSNTETSLADKIATLNNNSIGKTALTGSGRVSTSMAWDKAAGSYSFYAVIFADNAVAEGGKFIATATSTEYGWDNAADTAVAVGNQKTLTQDLSNWSSVATQATTDVPEPTSGLLLLLGVAGLALKRKRA